MPGTLISRILVFAGLGPLIGLVALLTPIAISSILILAAPQTASASAATIPDTTVYLFILAAAYAVGVVPALLAAIVEWYLATDPARERNTVAAGGIASFLVAAVFTRRVDYLALAATVSGVVAAWACVRIHDWSGFLQARARG